MVSALSPIGDGSSQHFSSVAPAARVIPTSGTQPPALLSPLFGGALDLYGDRYAPLLLCLWCGPKRVPPILGDGGDGGDENHDLHSAVRGGALASLQAGCKVRAGRLPGL